MHDDVVLDYLQFPCVSLSNSEIEKLFDLSLRTATVGFWREKSSFYYCGVGFPPSDEF